MFQPKVIINDDKNNEGSEIINPIDSNKLIEVLISVNPVYDWLDENINNISYKLFKGFITNIVPLGDAGKKYFKAIAHKKPGFTIELWKLYNQLKKIHDEGNLKISSYLELMYLGYTGISMDERCPVDDILKVIKRSSNKRNAVM